MKKRRFSILLIAILLFLVNSCDFSFKEKEKEQEEPATWDTAQSLHEIYENEFLMGNIIRNTGDFTNTARSGILQRHYNIVTAENDMKPSNLAPATPPPSDEWSYRFTTADTIVSNALAAGFAVHAHTLIWHTSQSPAWLAAGGEAYLNKYVTDVVTHFKGNVISWDVVNEAFRDGLTESLANTGWKNCLRQDAPWYQSIGEDYIEMAFLAARAADPDVKLYYNDYNLNSAGKARAVYNMVRDINSRYPDVEGRPLIDGIGMQSHHNVATDIQSVAASIQLFISLGVEIGITELDIVANNGGSVNDSRLGSDWNDSVAQKQAEQYAAMFKVFKDNARHISRVTFWGLDDGASWRGVNHPTLMNGDYSLKPAFFAVMNPDEY